MTDTYSDLGVRDAIRSMTADERRVMAALDVHHEDPACARDEAEDAAIERRKRGEISADTDRIAQLEMDLEWTQRQREHAEQCEAFADAARRAVADRADTAEQAVRQMLAAHYIGPAADNEGVTCPEGEALNAIAETLYEDWTSGTALADLDARALVRDWAKETGQ